MCSPFPSMCRITPHSHLTPAQACAFACSLNNHPLPPLQPNFLCAVTQPATVPSLPTSLHKPSHKSSPHSCLLLATSLPLPLSGLLLYHGKGQPPNLCLRCLPSIPGSALVLILPSPTRLWFLQGQKQHICLYPPSN